MERAETHAAVTAARRGTAAVASDETPAPRAALPELAVVKLKPRNDPAPKIDTRKAVVEPPPEVLEELVASASSPSARDDAGDSAATPAIDPQVADRDFEQSLEALRTGNLNGAAEALERFADENPKNPRADNALYFGALGRIGLEEHERAAALLERLIREYPAGDAVLDGILKLAECRMSLQQPSEAKALYHQVISTYPGTAAADKAQAKLAVLAP